MLKGATTVQGWPATNDAGDSVPDTRQGRLRLPYDYRGCST